MTTDADPPRPDFKHFCEVYKNWRAAIGASQDELARRGGPSDTLQTHIEACEWSSGRPQKTLVKVDAGFGWPPGTARDVLYDKFDPVTAGWPTRIDPDIEQVTRSTSTGEYRLQRWATSPHEESSPPSDYLRFFEDRQLLEELARRLSETGALVEQAVEEDHVDESEDDYDLAARRGLSQGQQVRRAQDEAGEESQE